MEVGLTGLLLETVLNHVVEEVNHLQDHVLIQLLNMVEITVSGKQQELKTAIQIHAQ